MLQEFFSIVSVVFSLNNKKHITHFRKKKYFDRIYQKVTLIITCTCGGFQEMKIAGVEFSGTAST